MKILEVKNLAIDGIKVIRFGRFPDHRGYFAEHFRQSDFNQHPELSFMHGVEFLQCNESVSKVGTIRGLHFQWNPYVGKLVRTVAGHMVDLVLDIRKGSPNLGKIVAYSMPSTPDHDYGEWIWVPPGFAHGNYFMEGTRIEYFCSGEYNPACEAGISPLAADIDWSICDAGLKHHFEDLIRGTSLITDKDKNGHSLASWLANPNSDHFIYRSQ